MVYFVTAVSGQLFEDLSHGIVSGVDVMQMMNSARNGTAFTAVAPYAFTSTIGLSAPTIEATENLRRRYVRDEFMTAVGPILVVINPFKYHATKYGTDVIRRYHQDSSLGIESPHVYDLAERAYTNLGSERVLAVEATTDLTDL